MMVIVTLMMGIVMMVIDDGDCDSDDGDCDDGD